MFFFLFGVLLIIVGAAIIFGDDSSKTDLKKVDVLDKPKVD
jgi:hypothetical protein